MASLPPSYVLLDGASALLCLVVAGGFWWVARWSRQGLHALLCAGFTSVAAGFLFVAASHFGDGRNADAADALRLACHTGGALVLVFAYAGARLPAQQHLLLAIGGASVAIVLLAALLWLIPPIGLPPTGQVFAAAHALTSAAFLGCAMLAGHGWHKRPTWGRAMVPLGFLAWAFSTYSWIFLDLAPNEQFLPLIYLWRFLALGLMLWAMVRRPRPWPRRRDAAA